MALNGSSGRGELRSAIEGLLRTCVELDRQSAAAGQEARKQAHAVARELAGLKLPGLDNLADEIVGIGSQMDTSLVAELAEARRPYLDEIHQLLGLLAPHHGVVDMLPPFTATAGAIHTADAFAGQFPPGFARRYVHDLITSVDRSANLAVDEAGRIAIVPADDVGTATDAAADGFDEAHRDQGVRLIADDACHAVEQHGPQIPDQAQLARLIWLKDPTGQYTWHVTPNGSVTTNHWAGTATGGFTSPEALAKPINALLRVADQYDGGMTRLLGDNAEDGRIAIHVGAEQSGLEPGDASGYRGAGTGTRETRRDWIKAREFALQNGRSTVYGAPYDPIAEGSDPGAMLVFSETSAGWQLVTCFPVDAQRPKSQRLEDLT